MYETNEAYLLQAGLWAEKLTVPVLWGGDQNETSDSSTVVALSKQLEFWRMTGDESTTWSKKGGRAANLAIV